MSSHEIVSCGAHTHNGQLSLSPKVQENLKEVCAIPVPRKDSPRGGMEMWGNSSHQSLCYSVLTHLGAHSQSMTLHTGSPAQMTASWRSEAPWAAGSRCPAWQPPTGASCTPPPASSSPRHPGPGCLACLWTRGRPLWTSSARGRIYWSLSRSKNSKTDKNFGVALHAIQAVSWLNRPLPFKMISFEEPAWLVLLGGGGISIKNNPVKHQLCIYIYI